MKFCPHCGKPLEDAPARGTPPRIPFRDKSKPRSEEKEYVRIEGKVVRVKEKSVLVQYIRPHLTMPEETWVPRSLMQGSVGLNDENLRVEKWFVEREQLVVAA